MRKRVWAGVVLWWASASPVLAQTATTPDRWFGLPPIVWGAAVGAISALVTSAIKDLVWPAFRDHQAKRADHDRIVRNYVAPLAATTEKCVWRFNELFVDKRHGFLRSSALPVGFNDYKRTSTLYRLAAVLGWMRAIDLELSSLKSPNPNKPDAVTSNLSAVRSAFAEGHHVEDLRLSGLLRLWNLPDPEPRDRKKLAVDLEVRLFDLAGANLEGASRGLPKLSAKEQFDIVYGLAGFLCGRLGRAPILATSIEETQHRAIAAITFREALIYRDWQDAIGDEMLEADDASDRRYRVVGYEKFCEILKSDKPWFGVLRDSIVDINFEQADPNDFREKQLRDLAKGVSKVYLAIRTSMQDVTTPAAETAAKRVLEMCQKA